MCAVGCSGLQWVAVGCTGSQLILWAAVCCNGLQRLAVPRLSRCLEYVTGPIHMSQDSIYISRDSSTAFTLLIHMSLSVNVRFMVQLHLLCCSCIGYVAVASVMLQLHLLCCSCIGYVAVASVGVTYHLLQLQCISCSNFRSVAVAFICLKLLSIYSFFLHTQREWVEEGREGEAWGEGGRGTG